MTETTPSRPADSSQLARWTIEAMASDGAGDVRDEQLDPAAERARDRVRYAVEALRAEREAAPA